MYYLLICDAVVVAGVLASCRHAEVVQSQVDVLTLGSVDQQWTTQSIVVAGIKRRRTQQVQRRDRSSCC